MGERKQKRREEGEREGEIAYLNRGSCHVLTPVCICMKYTCPCEVILLSTIIINNNNNKDQLP
jgi:hypothetical protein